MIYQTEKQLQEHSSRIPDTVKEQVRNDITKLNEAITSENKDSIREALERLKNSSMEIGKSIYSQQSSDANANQDQQKPEGENKQNEEKKEEKKD